MQRGVILTEARRAIPPHLLEYVVEQDYERYTSVDQAVWHFVLLQLATRLRATAHPAYRDGLALTGISLERIPRVEEMDEKLSRFGWGAVCVDGFIPPRAFQEFQAALYLPIAADMRTLPHLVYTPAPDIIHEAAGHAPILSNPEYAAYIARSGQVGARAFTLPADTSVYRAIYTLSEAKENPEATPDQVQRAELGLERALASCTQVSEASRLARLYWWTAEYGLVGTPSDYKLYGAGLLSSLWESYSCHDPAVRKLPLSPACVDVSYDITRPQPQLFVARDFAQLDEVLREVEQTLAFSVGGDHALACAQQSQELATLVFDGGYEAIAVLQSIRRLGGALAALELGGPTAFARAGQIIPGLGGQLHRDGQWLVVGEARGSETLPAIAERLATLRAGSTAVIRYRSGIRVEGTQPRPIRDPEGRMLALRFDLARVVDPERGEVWDGPFTWLPITRFETARAGASDPGYFAPTSRSAVRVPKPRSVPEREAELLALYERARESVRARGGSAAGRELERIHERLLRDFPDEWLLRWNLLEGLLQLGDAGPLTVELRSELEALEVRFEHREPIASGLHYLASHLS